MQILRVVDEIGNNQDYETAFVPRIGERIALLYRDGADAPLREHFFRVQDVEYRLYNEGDSQVAILVKEEKNATLWPS